MSGRDNGGPAFPWGEHGTHLGGMTLRDYFAAKAMQGLIASPRGLASFGATVGGAEYAKEAYEWADKMLEARSA